MKTSSQNQKYRAKLRQKRLRDRRKAAGSRTLRVTIDRDLALAVNLSSGAYGGSQEAVALDVLKRVFNEKIAANAAIRDAIGPNWTEIKNYLPYRGRLMIPGVRFTLRNNEVYSSERWAKIEPMLSRAMAIASRAYAQKDALNIVIKICS